MRPLCIYASLVCAILAASVSARAGNSDRVSYVPPADAAADNTELRAGSDRAIGTRVSLILANHRSLTFSAQPTLYWFVSGHVQQIEHLLFEGDALKPVFQETVRNVREAGMHALPLAERGIRLHPGVPYRWVAVIAPEGPGQALTQLAGEIMHVAPTPETAQKIARAPANRLPAVLGAAGAWPELIDALSTRATRGHDRQKWLGYRARVLRQVGLVDAARADEAQLPLAISLSAEQQRYRAGDALQVRIEANKRFFARLIYVDAAGNHIQLLPNVARSDNAFEGNTPYLVPGPFDQPLTVAPPFGREHVVLQASAEPLEPLPGRPLPNGFIHVPEETARKALRSAAAAQKTLKIVTEPRP